jgi:hypothetical protein
VIFIKLVYLVILDLSKVKLSTIELLYFYFKWISAEVTLRIKLFDYYIKLWNELLVIV